MLLEPGPIAPIDVDLWTRPGPRTSLEGDAAQLAAQLQGTQGMLGAKLATMASSPASRVELGAGADLNAAIAAHAAQPSDPDPTIGAIAGNADGQGTAIVGLGNEAADAIAQAEPPPPPPLVSHPADPSWGIGEGNPPEPPEEPPPPGGTVADFIIALYQKYLRRDPGLEGINAWSPLWPNADAIEHGILFSEEYFNDVNGLYHQYLGRDVEDGELHNHHENRDSLDSVEAQLQARA